MKTILGRCFGTLANPSPWFHSEVSPGVATRHARVRAPRFGLTSACVTTILAAILLAGCSATAARVDGSASSGGELRFVIRAEPKTLDPHVIVDEPSMVVQYLTGGVLIRQNRKSQDVEPALASSWKVLDGGRSIEFFLRTGVQFSDGTPFTARDVAFTMQRIDDPTLHSPVTETLKSAPGKITTEVRSPTDVIVHVPGRVANLPALFDQISIVSANSPKKLDAVLGPFSISEYKAGSYLLLRRNPHYWKKDNAGHSLPYLDSVRLDIQTNRELELIRFRHGEIHLVSGLDAESFDRLASEMPDSVQDLGPSLDSEQFWLNQVPTAPIPAYKREWFRSTNFRQALSRAINRDDLCRLVYRGHARPAGGPVSPGNHVWINNRIHPPAYSPEAAIALLTSAGFRLQNRVLLDREGHHVEFSVITNAGSKPRERLATLIQQDFARIGIKLNLVPMDFPSLIERITRNFQYEACLLGQLVELDPNEMLNVWRSSAPNHQWYPSQKTPATAWEAQMNRLMDDQAAATNFQNRKADYDRVQEIVADQLPFIYLVHKNALVGVSPKLRNAQPVILQPQTFWNVDTLAFKAS